MHLAQIGFSPSVHELVLGAFEQSGLLAICGTTGQGKTDSAQAVLWEGERRGRERHNLLSGVKCTDRLIDAGDLRELDETQRAVELAETNLVVAVFRSGFGPESVDRLAEMGIEPRQLRRINIWLITQRLPRALCALCRTPQAVSRHDFEQVGLAPEGWDLCGGFGYVAAGCQYCKNGYRGHVVLSEAFTRNDSNEFRAVGSIARHATVRVVAGELSLDEAATMIPTAGPRGSEGPARVES